MSSTPRYQSNQSNPNYPPPENATAAEQKEWTIPPCVSNWKNSKGFFIPLDKRLAADGCGIQDIYANDKFAREEVRQRSLMQQKFAQREKEAKENHLRLLAQRVHEERSGVIVKTPEYMQATINLSSGNEPDSESGVDSDDDYEARKIRDQMRAEKRCEREKEMRMNKYIRKN